MDQNASRLYLFRRNDYVNDHFNHPCDSCSLQIHQIMRVVSDIGKRPICNGHPERAPHIGTFCFPLCWRCTSFTVFCLGITPFLNNIPRSITVLVFTSILFIPCCIDVLFQKYTNYQSTNRKRVITGCLAGLGFRVFVHVCFRGML